MFIINYSFKRNSVVCANLIYPFCMAARGSRELFTLIIITDIKKKYKERIKHIL